MIDKSVQDMEKDTKFLDDAEKEVKKDDLENDDKMQYGYA